MRLGFWRRKRRDSGEVVRHTIRTCLCGGHALVENHQPQAPFACIYCGFEENADLTGAINVLVAGHAVLAC